jgi:hypothetical protein
LETFSLKTFLAVVVVVAVVVASESVVEVTVVGRAMLLWWL